MISRRGNNMNSKKKLDCIFSCNLKKIEDLQKLVDGLQSYNDAYVINEKVFFDFKLCLEEVIVNIFSHGYKESKIEPDVNIYLYKERDYFMAEIIDNGKTFNPVSSHNPVDFETSLEERPLGGLGIHLLKNLSDELEYILQPSGNRLKIYKKM